MEASMIWCSYCHQFHYEKHLEDECQHRRFLCGALRARSVAFLMTKSFCDF